MNLEEKINNAVNEAIKKAVQEYVNSQLNTNSGAYGLGYIHRWVMDEIKEKLVERYIDENYESLVSKLDSDKIIKLLEAKAAFKLLNSSRE